MLLRGWGHLYSVWGGVDTISNSNYEGFVSHNFANYSVAFRIFCEADCTSAHLGLNVSIAAVIIDTYR